MTPKTSIFGNFVYLWFDLFRISILGFRISYSKTFSSRHFLPACLGHSGDLALTGKLPETDPADLEFTIVPPRAAASLTTEIAANFELRLPLTLFD
jgi:hypothetical protein